MRNVSVIAVPLLVAASLVATGCGSDSKSDKDKVNDIVNEGNKDPSSICTHLSAATLKQFVTVDKCKTAAKGQPTDQKATIDSTTVSGDTATVQITGAKGKQTIKFVKEGGDWKVQAG